MFDIYQEKNIDWIVNALGKETMIPVWGKITEDENNMLIACYILPSNESENELDDISWRISDIHGLSPGFVSSDGDNYKYFRYSNFGNKEPFVIERNFPVNTDKYNCLEIAEDFRLLFNLYYDEEKNSYIDLLDDTVVVSMGEIVKVRKSYLKKYLGARQYCMVIRINNQKYISTSAKEDISYKNNDVAYNLCIGHVKGTGGFSMLNAKKIVYGCPMEECGIYPYEAPKEYVEFDIKEDDNGNKISYSCNYALLNDWNNSHPEAPGYLTLVFFSAEVLKKYYDNPERYSVENGMISMGNRWSLYVDNDQVDKGFVSAYLGDLGRDLPLSEQKHWQSYNIVIDGQLSDAKFKRDFLAELASSESIDYIFRKNYDLLKSSFFEKEGWNIYLELSEDDQYHVNNIRLLLSNTIKEFDSAVLSLTKVLIESLNEKCILKEIKKHPDIELKENEKGISKLEIWLKNVKEESGYEEHIKFLRNLYELRSSGIGHRKGSGYTKISKVFKINGNNYKTVFKEILTSANKFLDFMLKIEKF